MIMLQFHTQLVLAIAYKYIFSQIVEVHQCIKRSL